MKTLIKQFPKQVDVGLLIMGFTLGANFFVFLKLGGIQDLGIDFSSLSEGFHWSNATIAGLMIGISLSVMEFKVLPLLPARLPCYLVVLARITLFSLSIVLSAALVHTLADLLYYGDSFAQSLSKTRQFIFSTFFLTLFIYLMLLGMSLNFLRAVGNRFGHGILINYLLGKYKEPVEENRIFMFIDLNGSTKIAEKLGHTKYSRFLNKCFIDLSSLLPKYDAEIYQYVGDEAVVTWNMNRLKDHTKPAFLFFAFERLLQRNEKDYLGKFGVPPTFKASINAGPVIVTELGIRRKELAYHGDVLNTASRVLELCNKLKKRLLTTSTLFDAFKKDQSLSINFVSDLVLRGKNDKTAVYGVEMVMP